MRRERFVERRQVGRRVVDHRGAGDDRRHGRAHHVHHRGTHHHRGGEHHHCRHHHHARAVGPQIAILLALVGVPFVLLLWLFVSSLQQDIRFADPGYPAIFTDAGQRGEFEHAQGLPSQLAHGAAGLAGDEPPSAAGAALRVPVQRGGDAQGVGLGDGLAQQADQRFQDARVPDARGGQQELHCACPVCGSEG